MASTAQPSAPLALAKDWRLFRNCAVLGVLLAVLAVVLLGKSYTTSVSFAPQGDRLGQMGGLAAQLGFDVAGVQGAESPFFYVELLGTNEVLSAVVKSRFQAEGKTGDYATLLGLKDSNSAVRTDKAIKALKGQIKVLADRRTGIVTIDVTEGDPQLTLQLASKLVEEVAHYNRESRQSRAAAERRFVESRLNAARKEASNSEDSLQTFLTKNREFRTSPQLTFEFDRLQRSVSQRTSVVTTLAQTFEQARIDEVRDTPVISLVQPPRLPARANSRGLLRAVALGLIAGLFLGFLIQVSQAAIERLRAQNPDEYQGWQAALSDLRRNLLRP